MVQFPPVPEQLLALPTRRLLSLVLSFLLLAAVASLVAKEQPKYALVYGSIFDDRGLAFRGALVIVTPAPRSGPGATARDKRRWTGVSDGRGEFAIRLPAGKGSYSVAVEAAGFAVEPKSIEIKAEERVDLLFRLKRVTEPKP
jgi:hypothetical protein